ncbi:lysophospholipid acyltransferase family protein [Dermabacteraceae bacterium P13101]
MRELASRLFYDSVRRLLNPVLYGFWRPRVSGLENIPREGSVIIAANHLANADSAVLPILTPRRIHFLVKSTYWHNGGLSNLLQRLFFTAAGAIPVDRGTLHSAQGSLEVALKYLQRGEAFGIYPEGTRSRDGRLYKGRGGAAWLAFEADAPIIPVGLRGTQHFWPSGSKRPLRHPFTIRFGEPIHPADIAPGKPKSVRRRELTEVLMRRIAELSGQEYVDRLNTPAPQTK